MTPTTSCKRKKSKTLADHKHYTSLYLNKGSRKPYAHDLLDEMRALTQHTVRLLGAPALQHTGPVGPTRGGSEERVALQIAHLDADDVGVEAGDELGESGPVALHPEEQAVGVPRQELARLLGGPPLSIPASASAGAGWGGAVARFGSGRLPLRGRGAVLGHWLEEALHRPRTAGCGLRRRLGTRRNRTVSR